MKRAPIAIPVERQPPREVAAVVAPFERQSPREAAAMVAVPVEREPAREAMPIALRVGATRAVATAEAPPVSTAPPAPRARVAAPRDSPSRTRAVPAPAREPVAVPVGPARVARADGSPAEPAPAGAAHTILSPTEQNARRARVLGGSFLFGFVAALGIVLTVGTQLHR